MLMLMLETVHTGRKSAKPTAKCEVAKMSESYANHNFRTFTCILKDVIYSLLNFNKLSFVYVCFYCGFLFLCDKPDIFFNNCGAVTLN